MIDQISVISGVVTAWIIWVSGVCALVTMVAYGQRKAMNAAFNKIRCLEDELKKKQLD